MIEGIRRIQDMMERQIYITDRAIATTTYLASELRKARADRGPGRRRQDRDRQGARDRAWTPS